MISSHKRERRRLKNDPWEVLVVGALFFFPGLFMLFHHGPLIGVQQGYRYTYMAPAAMSAVTAISEHGAHIFGALAIAVGLVFFWFYFYLRRLIARSTPFIVEHGNEQI